MHRGDGAPASAAGPPSAHRSPSASSVTPFKGDGTCVLGDYLHLPPLRRGRRAGLPRRRRARRALAMAWWARGGAAWHARPPRRAISADSTTSPNSPATPREHSFGCSRPTRRPCAILVGPAPCPSRRAPPPATRLARGFASWSYDVEFLFSSSRGRSFLTPRLPTRRANGASSFPSTPCPRREVRAWERGTAAGLGGEDP